MYICSRKIICIVQDGTCRLGAFSDALGRVCLLDLTYSPPIIIRMWKGYRDAQLAFFQSNNNTNKSNKNSKQKERKIYSQYLTIYAPRRGLLEIWKVKNGSRQAVFNVGEECILINDSLCFGKDPNRPGKQNCFLINKKTGKIIKIYIDPFLYGNSEFSKENVTKFLSLTEEIQINFNKLTKEQIKAKKNQMIEFICKMDAPEQFTIITQKILSISYEEINKNKIFSISFLNYFMNNIINILQAKINSNQNQKLINSSQQTIQELIQLQRIQKIIQSIKIINTLYKIMIPFEFQLCNEKNNIFDDFSISFDLSSSSSSSLSSSFVVFSLKNINIEFLNFFDISLGKLKQSEIKDNENLLFQWLFCYDNVDELEYNVQESNETIKYEIELETRENLKNEKLDQDNHIKHDERNENDLIDELEHKLQERNETIEHENEIELETRENLKNEKLDQDNHIKHDERNENDLIDELEHKLQERNEAIQEQENKAEENQKLKEENKDNSLEQENKIKQDETNQENLENEKKEQENEANQNQTKQNHEQESEVKQDEENQESKVKQVEKNLKNEKTQNSNKEKQEKLKTSELIIKLFENLSIDTFELQNIFSNWYFTLPISNLFYFKKWGKNESIYSLQYFIENIFIFSNQNNHSDIDFDPMDLLFHRCADSSNLHHVILLIHIILSCFHNNSFSKMYSNHFNYIKKWTKLKNKINLLIQFKNDTPSLFSFYFPLSCTSFETTTPIYLYISLIHIFNKYPQFLSSFLIHKYQEIHKNHEIDFENQFNSFHFDLYKKQIENLFPNHFKHEQMEIYTSLHEILIMMELWDKNDDSITNVDHFHSSLSDNDPSTCSSHDNDNFVLLQDSICLIKQLHDHPEIIKGICLKIWKKYLSSSASLIISLLEKYRKVPKERILIKTTGMNLSSIIHFLSNLHEMLTILLQFSIKDLKKENNNEIASNSLIYRPIHDDNNNNNDVWPPLNDSLYYQLLRISCDTACFENSLSDHLLLIQIVSLIFKFNLHSIQPLSLFSSSITFFSSFVYNNKLKDDENSLIYDRRCKFLSSLVLASSFEFVIDDQSNLLSDLHIKKDDLLIQLVEDLYIQGNYENVRNIMMKQSDENYGIFENILIKLAKQNANLFLIDQPYINKYLSKEAKLWIDKVC